MINVEIHNKIVHKNIATLKTHLRRNVKVCAVIKANAYSLGDVEIAKSINSRVDMFAVAHLREAKRVLPHITKPVLLFGVCSDFPAAINLGLVISINSLAEGRKLIKVLDKLKPRTKTKIHIKVNTGLNRYGLSNPWQLRNMLGELIKCPHISIDGLYTHFAHESCNMPSVTAQLKRFKPFITIMRSYAPYATIHAASSGTAHHQPAQFGMVRVGKLLYGAYPGYETAIRATAPVVSVSTARCGTPVGYEHAHTTTCATKVGVIACGYADIAHLTLGNSGHVLIDGKKCKIIGNVCMDCLMVDVTHLAKPLGKPATLFGAYKHVRFTDQLTATNANAHDMLCGLNFQRTDVVYK